MRKLAIGLALVAATLLGPTGCRQPAPPLRVGLLVWPPFELAYLARDFGYYGEAPIQLVDYVTPAAAVHAQRNGLVDVIAVTTGYAVEAAAEGRDVRIFMAVDVSVGGDALLMRGDLATPSELRGGTVGAERSALGEYFLARALHHLDLDPAEVSVVGVDVADHRTAFLAGELDAVATYEPIRSVLLAEGAVEIFSSRDIPGEIVDVLLADARLLEQRREDVQALVDGWLKAAERLRAGDRAVVEHVARNQGVGVEVLERILQGMDVLDREANVEALAGDAPGLLEPTARLAAEMESLGLLSHGPSVERLLDGSFVVGGPP